MRILYRGHTVHTTKPGRSSAVPSVLQALTWEMELFWKEKGRSVSPALSSAGRTTHLRVEPALAARAVLAAPEGEEAHHGEDTEQHAVDRESEAGAEEARADGADAVVVRYCGGGRGAGVGGADERGAPAGGRLRADVAPLQCRVDCDGLHDVQESREWDIAGRVHARELHLVGLEPSVVRAVLELEPDDGFGAVRGGADLEGDGGGVVDFERWSEMAKVNK